MKRIVYFLCFLLFSEKGVTQVNTNTSILFDENWKFFRGGVLDGENISFDDSKWRILNGPDDWSIENLPNSESSFNKDAISQVGGGFSVGGTGWYRKYFFPDSKDSIKKIHILFEGVYMNADVWVNGNQTGNQSVWVHQFLV